MKKVDIEIDKAVLKKTTRCNYDCSCLSGNHSCMCSIVDQTGISSIKVTPNPYRSCSYHLRFHKSHYCVCPTRREILKNIKSNLRAETFVGFVTNVMKWYLAGFVWYVDIF